MSTQTRTPTAGMTTHEVDLFRQYLAGKTDVRYWCTDAYGEQYYRISCIANILAAELEWHTDPAHGTPAKRLAAIKAAREQFVEARTEIRDMFDAWLDNR